MRFSSLKRTVPLVLLVVLGVGYFLLHSSKVDTPSRISGQIIYWQDVIRRDGAVAAYREFTDSVLSLNQDKQHLAAHLFGVALYKESGTKNLSVCDQRFSYGCFHEVMGKAIAEGGLGVVPGLDEACGTQAGGDALVCRHGIGHGVLAALGYDAGSLKKALDVCRASLSGDPIGGCYGGAFMEYDMQTMLGAEGQVRLAGSGMFSPCDGVADAYKKACYFWRPQWWHRLLWKKDVNEREIAREMGELCASVASSTLSRTCFQGIGNITKSNAGFDARETVALCEAVSANPQEQSYCKEVAIPLPPQSP